MEKQQEPKLYLFLKKSQVNSKNEARIFFRLTAIGCRPLEISTRLSVSVKLWDQKNQQLKEPLKNRDLHQQITNMHLRILEIHETFIQEGNIYTQKPFCENLHCEKQPTQCLTYKFIYQKHFDIYGEDIAPGTWKNYRSTNLRFLEFLKHEFRAADLEIERINRQLIIEFIAWLKKRNPDKGQRVCTHTTAQKHTERIVRLLSFAVEMQYLPFQPIVGLKKKHVPKTRVCLDQFEIDALENFQFAHKFQEEIRDPFLFSCYTGLSFGDILSLNKDDLITDIYGNRAISKVREKTHRSRQIKFFVPLLPKAMLLVEKYRDHEHCRIKNVLLPVRSNQEYNNSLKTLQCLWASIKI